ncbi:28524_t:CDS:2 [Racocetra persica]|uniref:28524_t:CDS:1 n=1 Tax=Racocetra persica TaxID=160502 RepID=A0ACA9LEJ2_9GLOM|nr:28524_t:CDS:2 [Racocetra persica]
MTNEEIEVLQTIYTHDFTISNTNPRWYGVMVATGDSYQHENDESIEQQYVHVLFHEPPGYPSVPVEVRIATPVLITNSKASNSLNVNDGNVKEELEIILNLKAQEMANNEEFAMYEIAELARNWLWDNQQLSNTFNVSHDWWVGELPDRIFNWQTNSYSPSKITELQFRVEFQVIENIQENCNIKVDVAKVRSFLMMNLWNVEKTIEAITKNINENNHDANISITHVATDDVDETSCNICLDTFLPCEMITFVTCNHRVCNECLIQYLSLKISENRVFTIECPGAINCPYFVDPITIGRLLSPKLVYKYYSCLRESFNQLQQHTEITKKSTSTSHSTKKFSWCINPKCNHSLSQHSADSIELPTILHCKGCTSTWCSSCDVMSGHWPSSCKDYETYLLTNHTIKSLKINKTQAFDDIMTKPCPKCKILISKNGGCMHMTCRFCQYQFCWGCLVEWRLRVHGNFYECDQQIDGVETSFEVFDINDMQFLLGILQRKFKQDVIIHSQTIRKEQVDLDILIKQYKNGLNTKNVRKLRIYITKLLIQIHYVIKFASVGLFCKSDKDKNEVKKGMEILQRLEFGLGSLENVREQIIEIERDNFGQD